MKCSYIRTMKLVLLLIIGILAVGAGAAFLSNNNGNQSGFQAGVGGSPQNDNEQDPNLAQRAKLHKLLQEHSAVGAIHLQDLYDGEDTDDTMEQMNRNANELNALLIEISGQENSELLPLWTRHMEEYESYTLAKRDGDEEQAEQVRENLETTALEFGQIINSMLSDVSEEDATNAMQEHINLTLSIVDEHAEDDDAAKAVQMTKASAQAASFAETLVP